MYNGNDETPSGQLIILDKVKAEKTEWLWYPYIPCGKVTIIQGDPGEGKSTLVLNLLAAVSRGIGFPGSEVTAEPRYSLYQNAEDGLADTVKPRLEAAEADCKKIVTFSDPKDPLSMADARLEVLLQFTKAAVLVLDPLQAYLGDRVDMHRANEIRPVMHMLAELAERYKCAIILIGHMNKMSGTKSIYRGLGSIDLTAAARSVLTVARDPKHPENRVIMQVKNSLAPEGEPVAFTLDENGKFKYLGAYEVDTEALLTQAPKQQRKLRPHDRAEALILEWLERENPLYVKDIYDIADSEGITKATLLRAKERLGVMHVHTENGWIWQKP